MRYCKKCTMPDTRPGITFDAEGVCSACRHYEARKNVDWDARFKEFEAYCDKYRGMNGPGGYDCAVAVSGGKAQQRVEPLAREFSAEPARKSAPRDGPRYRAKLRAGDRLAPEGELFLRERGEKRLVLGERFAHARDARRRAGVDALESREHVEPDAVSRSVRLRVRGVLHMGDAVRGEIFLNVAPRRLQKRADDAAAPRRDAGESAQSRAARHAEEDGLRIVV